MSQTAIFGNPNPTYVILEHDVFNFIMLQNILVNSKPELKTQSLNIQPNITKPKPNLQTPNPDPFSEKPQPFFPKPIFLTRSLNSQNAIIKL